jgi:hypothetical protein
VAIDANKSFGGHELPNKHIARVVCSFLAAAVPITIVKTFILNGVSLLKDGDHVLCTVRLDQARRLLVPLESGLLGIENSMLADSDEERASLFEKMC